MKVDTELTPEEQAEQILTDRDWRDAAPLVREFAEAGSFPDDVRLALRDRARRLMRGTVGKDAANLAALAGVLNSPRHSL